MILLNIFTLILIITRGIVGLPKTMNAKSSDENLEILPGFQIILYDHEIQIKLDLKKMFPANAVQGKKHNDDEDNKTPGEMLQKFGSMIVMIPLITQMLSLPGAIASIKMSLLKSLLVAKLALFVMLFNMFRNQQHGEVVVIHQPSAQHHDHFYPHFHEEDENNDIGWFG